MNTYNELLSDDMLHGVVGGNEAIAHIPQQVFGMLPGAAINAILGGK